NLSRFPEVVELELEEYAGRVPMEVFSRNKFPAIKNDPYMFTLSGHGYYWLELKKQAEQIGDGGELQLPSVQLEGLKSTLSQRSRRQLETSVLPQYMMKRRWFGGKARNIQRMEVVNNIPFPMGGSHALLLVIEVNYNEGLPEIYQVPIAVAEGEFAQELLEQHPNSVIARATVQDEDGILYDALYNEEFRQELLTLIARRRKVKQNGGEIVGESNRQVAVRLRKAGELPSRILGAEQSNTSIIY